MSETLRLRSLRRLRDAAPLPLVAAACQQCGAALQAEHRHIADLDARCLLCVCARCHAALHGGDAAGSRRAVPRRILRLSPTFISDADWYAFEIPVGIAFFFHNDVLGRTVAAYPSPAGATESLLPATVWERVLRASPWTRTLVPDVEALLVRRSAGTPADAEALEDDDCFLVPIDVCYELVGRIRRSWSGFGGGPEVRAEIDAFFADLRTRSEQVST